MIRTSAVALALALGFTGTACAQEAAEPALQATPVSEESAPSGFNLRIPGEEPAETYSGFNLSIPGETSAPGVRLPDNAVSSNAFEDLPDVGAATPEASEPGPSGDDEIIRLEP
ncbi:MAG: hypothetical protein AAFW65_00835 [Pseudomonadota bacterium]